MLRFAVFDNDGPAQQWPLVNAHLLGPEDRVVQGRISFRDGHVRCRRAGSRAVALCLQYEAPPVGNLMLRTCLLPEREAPYVLSVELARHRIKMFIAKSEEWQMFDLSAGHPAMRHWEEARQLLTRALTADDPRRADEFAHHALAQGVEASERLAMAHAEVLLHRRFAHRAASSATLGVRLWPGATGDKLKELIASNFDLLVLPLCWREIEIEEGKYDWDPLDRWMQWAQQQGKPIIAGPLLDFSKRSIPDWMYVWQHDYTTTRDLAYEYAERIVHRYRDLVGMWNIASGINTNENFQFTAEQMLDLTRMANLLVRQAKKGARTMLELRWPFGEHRADDRSSIGPMTMLDHVMQGGITFDALGVQLLFGQCGGGRTMRDIAQISSLLDRFLLLDLPVLVSALGVPSQPVDAHGGTWHGPWDPDRQARWVGRLFAVAMSKPFVESVFWTDLFDHAAADLPGAGLLDADGRPKPALKRLTGMRRRMRKPLGPLNLPSRVDT